MLACRMCKGDRLSQVLDLGFSPPADRFLRKDQLNEPEVYYPLRLVVCTDCGLAQLDHVVSPEILYRHDYPYESSMTKAGHLHWREFAQSTTERLALGPDDLVVDIGSNVGVLLEAFRSHGTRILGVEPASNIVRIAERNGIESLCEFFSADVAAQIVRDKGRASVVTATNVFAHVDDLDSLMASIRVLLKPGGAFIVEAPYFVNLVRNLEYDTIYHEHLSYLSLRPLIRFVKRFDMEVFDVVQRDIHGGSFRVFIADIGKMPVSPAVEELVRQEEAAAISSPQTLAAFSAAVKRNSEELLWLLRSLKRQQKRIAAVSAPAKGMTLLNCNRIGPETIDFVTEKSTLKIGRFTPGAHIPVVPDDQLVDEMPDFALLLAWNFAEEIIANLSDYRRRGGTFIIPIPRPTILPG